MQFIKSISESVTWLIAKVLLTIVISTLAFKTIQISFFGYFVLGADAFQMWNWWANGALGIALIVFGAYLVGSTWGNIKVRFARKG